MDPALVLHVDSITLAADHMVINLPASKTNPFRLGVKVVAPLVGGPECLVAHLCPLLLQPASSPLFGLGASGMEPLSHSTFVATLHCTIAASGLAPTAYAGHSICQGAMTWAAHIGATTNTIQCMGHWNSDCFWCYINCSASEQCNLSFAALFRICNSLLIPDCTLW